MLLFLRFLLGIVGLIVLPILGFIWGVFVPVFITCVLLALAFAGVVGTLVWMSM